MKSVILKKSKNYLKNPLFSIVNSQVIFYYKKHELRFDLNLISNVRLIKIRVFYINILLTCLGVLFYMGIVVFLNPFLSPYYFPLYLIVILYLSFLYEQFSYKLLINKQYLVFHELKISSKNIPYAQQFISVYKKIKIKKSNQNL